MNDVGATLLAITLGLGLATAAGLRVFVPLLGAGLAARFGLISLHDGFAWLGEPLALVALGTAALLEVVAYHVPWLDHALDTVATPAALVSGIMASAAVVADVPPLVRWAIAIIGGGGVAGVVQGLTVATRIKSTVATGGLGNPLVSTAETLGAVVVVVMAVFVPLASLALVVATVILTWRWLGRLAWRRHAP
ncbi:MAG: DUF4126 domain-containing protein [Gemmatimonadaceae bacterium]|nr:DUF4126 domain-containing protein [Gemmatimonadaceae bacterium]